MKQLDCKAIGHPLAKQWPGLSGTRTSLQLGERAGKRDYRLSPCHDLNLGKRAGQN